MKIGQKVVILKDDKVYPRKSAKITKLDKRENKPYLGLEISGVNHVVWRFEDQVNAT